VLAAGEVLTGAILLAPFVPAAIAGAGLTGLSGSLLALYARTPSLRKPGRVWPAPAGIAVSNDVWMLGIGLGLLAREPNPGVSRAALRRIRSDPSGINGPALGVHLVESHLGD
jgi:hypothetical protein